MTATAIMVILMSARSETMKSSPRWVLGAGVVPRSWGQRCHCPVLFMAP